MREITLVMPYYENAGMLEKHYETLRNVQKEVRALLRLIVVDDGSPNNPAKPGNAGVPLEIYRIGVDIRWNQDAARNIGMYHAQTEWRVMTDIDHLIPATTWQWLVTGDISPYIAYKFTRVSAPDLAPYKPHPNSYLMSKRTWDLTGGYDERFAGYYGTDGDFRDRVNQVATVINLPEIIIRYPREVIPDASTTQYARKSPEDKAIGRIKGERAAIPGWRPLQRTFPYQRVYPQ